VGEETAISQIVRYGYARPREADPEAMLQVTQLIRAGCGSITIETPANSNDEAVDGNRLTALLQSMEPGGELVIPFVGHVVRNSGELLTLLDHVEAQGQVLTILDPPFTTANGGLGALRVALEIVRQGEESEGRPDRLIGLDTRTSSRIRAERVRSMLAQGYRPTTIAKALGISRTSVYRFKQDTIAAAEAEAVA